MSEIRPATPCWYVRGATHPVTGLTAVTCLRGHAHPDGATVAADADRGDAEELWALTLDGDGRPVVRVAADPTSAGGVWFVALGAEAQPDRTDDDEVDLVAFDTPDVPAGTIVTDAEFRALPVANEAQVGAIRWSRRTAVIDQVYVLPERRRRRVGTLLLYAASALHQASGWPGALRADGRRTRLGDRLVGALPHPQRVAPWTLEAPPMDPPGTDGGGEDAGTGPVRG